MGRSHGEGGFEQRLGGCEGEISQVKIRVSVLQAKGIVRAKALRWEHAWCVQGTAPNEGKGQK